jgi:coenzyme PQQ synthesis protein D (PqqD)
VSAWAAGGEEIAATKPKARDDLAVLECENEAVVYDPRNDRVHQLNASAALVFGLCDGTATVKETAAELAEAFGRPPKEIEPDVRSVVRGFKEAQLLLAKSTGGTESKAEHDADERERVRMEVPRSG